MKNYHLYMHGLKALIQNKNGEYLLLRATKKGEEYRDIPGGRLEKGEDISDALKREVYEETGMEITTYEYIGTLRTQIEISDDIGEIYGLMLSFYQCSLSKEAIMTLSEEHIGYEWVSKKTMIERISSELGISFDSLF